VLRHAKLHVSTAQHETAILSQCDGSLRLDLSGLYSRLTVSTAAARQSGRETLENAIRMVNAKPEWAAHVVYGDTDSLFVHLPGRWVACTARADPGLKDTPGGNLA
jgi:DNA polymerase elongation subunit (family B)